MKVVVLGAAGILGRAMLAELSGHQAAARTRADYDLRDHVAAARDFDALRPDAVVNCAAYTRVDDAEDEPDLVNEVNGLAPGRLAAAAAAVGARFVQLSSDYVFNGESDRPWREDDPTDPLSVYGKSKLRGETEVRQAAPQSLIVRTSWLFGPGGRSFPLMLTQRLQAGERKFKVVDDQVGRPTYSRHLARAIVSCLEKDRSGVYHAGNAGAMSWYQFAGLVFRCLGMAGHVEVTPVSSGEWAARARRPRYSILDTAKLEAALGGPLPQTGAALAEYFHEVGIVAAGCPEE